MDLLITIVVGGIIGWLASMIMKTGGQTGIFGNIIVGIVGSWLGFWLAGLIGIGASGGIGRWLIAVLGAVVLIWILKLLNVFK